MVFPGQSKKKDDDEVAPMTSVERGKFLEREIEKTRHQIRTFAFAPPSAVIQVRSVAHAALAAHPTGWIPGHAQ